jgi:D-amino-acid dehydrogenase
MQANEEVGIAVIGGGVIGLSTAVELASRGNRVTLLERAEIGGGSSSGNAGWMTPGWGPLPAPEVLRAASRWLGRRDSPLRLELHLRPSYLGWLLRFARSCTETRFRAGAEAIARLGERTAEVMGAWIEAGVDFEGRRDGILMVFLDPAVLDHHRQDIGCLGDGEPSARPLSAAEVHDRVPAAKSGIAGGILFDHDWHLQPEVLTASLRAHAEGLGVRIRPGVAVEGARTRGREVATLTTSQGEMKVDSVVVAAGAETRRLTAKLGAEMPIEAGKGHALDLPAAGVEAPSPLYLYEAKVAVSPFDGRVRLAGMMELGARDPELSEARIATLVRSAGDYLALDPIGGRDRPRRWSGMRPMTPDGLPVIGRLPGLDNTFVASGHGMLGVTLAASTGATLAEFVTTGRRPDLLEPFDPARFSAA